MTLLKAIALRLDAQTVQFFVDESAADGKKFPLFEEALKLWRHPERMVRTAVRTIVLSVCRVDDDAARRVVGGCTLLPTQLLASVRAEHGRLVAALARKPPPPNKPAAAAAAALVSAAEDALQQLLDELYFVNDLLETNVPALAPALSAALLSQFALALLAAPLTDQLPPTLRAAASAAAADADAAAAAADADDDGDAYAAAGYTHADADDVVGAPPKKLAALLLLAQSLCVFTHAPALRNLVTLFLHPRLLLSRVTLTPTIALPLADRGPECNPLRRALLRALDDDDERVVHLAAAAVLAAARCTAVGSETLRQAELLPLRQLRSQSLLERLLQREASSPQVRASAGAAPPRLLLDDQSPEKTPGAPPVEERRTWSQSAPPTPAVTAAAPSTPPRAVAASAAATPAAKDTAANGSSAASLLHRLFSGEHAETPAAAASEAACEYFGALVTALLRVCNRAARPPPPPSTPVAALVAAATAASERSMSRVISMHSDNLPAADGGDGGGEAPLVRVVTLQAALELLFELVSDGAPDCPLRPPHAAALRRAHASAAAALRAALNGRFAASIGGLVDYECRQLPRNPAADLRLSRLLSDPALLLPASSAAPAAASGARPTPLPHRRAATELEETRATILRFLLLRHARNVLCRQLPDDVHAFGKSTAAPPPSGLVIEVAKPEAQTLSCVLMLPPPPPPAHCRLLISTFGAVAGGSADGAHRRRAGARAGHHARPHFAAGGGRRAAGLLSPPAASASASASAYSPTEGAASFTYTTLPRGAKAAAAASATEMRVLLALPLDAVSVAMDAKSSGASRLAVGVSKEYAPAGVSPDAPLLLEFAEGWRCAAARQALDKAVAEVRAEHGRRLDALLAEAEADAEP